MHIPIQNIYFLLCYAWDKLEESEKIKVDIDDFNSLIELYAKVVYEGTLHILKAGIDRDYITVTDAIPGIKGKLLFGDSLKQNSFKKGKAVCEYDELSTNILHNQILKTTIDSLLRIKELSNGIKLSLSSLLNKLNQIDTIKMQKRYFSTIRLHRNNLYYGFVLNVCELIFDSIALNEQMGNYEFIDFVRDDKKMAALFEAFILNFYKKELTSYSVSSPVFQWNAQPLGESSLDYLPRMETDIVLESKVKTIIIDTKFYRETLKKRHDKYKINRDHLFQIFAYMQNYNKSAPTLEGMLLYPTVQDEVDQSFLIHGQKISVKTINLNQPWKQIDARLKELIQ